MGDIKMEESTQLTEREQRKILFRLLSYTSPHKKLLVLAFIFLLLTTVGDIVLPIIVKIFIDDYLTPGKLAFQPLLILGSIYMAI